MDTHQTLTEFKQITELCRYCLMCRHTCPITHVTHTEATSPHGWGILVASVERGITDWNEENVDVLYQCSDCGMCQAHCVTDQPLPLAINASRADVVEQQKAPAEVYNIQKKLQQWGNPYAETAPAKVTGQGEAALIVGAAGKYLQPETVDAAVNLLAAAGVEVVPIAIGRESPYLPNTLGLPNEARMLGQATLDEVETVGAKRVFVLSPGDIYTYHGLFYALGIPWPRHIEILEVTTFLADQLEAGTLSFNPIELSPYTFFDPDHTVRVPDRWKAPRKLLAAASQTPPIEMFWRKDRAMTSGGNSGLVFTQPELAAKLAQTRLAEAAERDIKTLITDDPHVLHHLSNQAKNGIAVRGLFELLSGQL